MTNKVRVAFVTREPVVHQFGGSTTAALNLLEVLVAQGCEVEVLIASAYSRTPKLFWKHRVELPAGVKLHTPGFIGVGAWFLNPFSLRAWGRFLARLSVRAKGLRWLRWFGDATAWDLTEPGPRETEAALRFVAERDADVVVVNYAFWAPIFAKDDLISRGQVILMHDLLSARVKRFQEAGVPLDCVPISLATELGWLNLADIVLAIQDSEAEVIRPMVRTARVMVQPIVLPLREVEPPGNRHRCLFVGTRIVPNQTGIQWLLDEVWPLVLAEEPRATLAIVGTVCEVVHASSPGVLLLGTVESLQTEFRAAAVCVVPLLIGSGIKIKLLEALAYGKACVSTPVGVQGLEGEAAIAVASEPQAFAAAVLRLMREDELREARERAALELVGRRFRPESEAVREFAHEILR